jgi:hypothetical protein
MEDLDEFLILLPDLISDVQNLQEVMELIKEMHTGPIEVA